jgi:hypothetical protein
VGWPLGIKVAIPLPNYFGSVRIDLWVLIYFALLSCHISRATPLYPLDPVGHIAVTWHSLLASLSLWA